MQACQIALLQLNPSTVWIHKGYKRKAYKRIQQWSGKMSCLPNLFPGKGRKISLFFYWDLGNKMRTGYYAYNEELSFIFSVDINPVFSVVFLVYCLWNETVKELFFTVLNGVYYSNSNYFSFFVLVYILAIKQLFFWSFWFKDKLFKW